jgi:hypothetical protein
MPDTSALQDAFGQPNVQRPGYGFPVAGYTPSCACGRQIVYFTPGRPLVTPGVRRTLAVNGLPRAPWPKTLGVQDQLVTWRKPKTCPSWLTREALAALPEALVPREVRYHLGISGCRTRRITLVTTLLDAQVYGVADLAEL